MVSNLEKLSSSVEGQPEAKITASTAVDLDFINRIKQLTGSMRKTH